MQKIKSNQRKISNFLINPKFQLKYVFWISFFGLLLLAVNFFTYDSFTSENYELMAELVDMTPEAKEQLDSELMQIKIYMGIYTALFIVIVTIAGLVISHRVAGPMYKLKKTFLEIADGNKDLRIKLRPGDEFQDVAEGFNHMMDKIVQKE